MANMDSALSRIYKGANYLSTNILLFTDIHFLPEAMISYNPLMFSIHESISNISLSTVIKWIRSNASIPHFWCLVLRFFTGDAITLTNHT